MDDAYCYSGDQETELFFHFDAWINCTSIYKMKICMWVCLGLCKDFVFILCTWKPLCICLIFCSSCCGSYYGDGSECKACMCCQFLPKLFSMCICTTMVSVVPNFTLCQSLCYGFALTFCSMVMQFASSTNFSYLYLILWNAHDTFAALRYCISLCFVIISDTFNYHNLLSLLP